MPTISDLIGLDIAPEEKKRRKEEARVLMAPLTCCERAEPSAKYECEVFNWLLSMKETLGIRTVVRFGNLRVDGAVVLADGRRLAVEVKLRMNWKKALEAGYEFRRFLWSEQAGTNPVAGAIVFFERFQGGGWDRSAKSRFLENGWNEWYRSHHRVEGYSLDLLRLCQGELESYGTTLATRRHNKTLAEVTTAYERLSHDEKAQLSERLTDRNRSERPI